MTETNEILEEYLTRLRATLSGVPPDERDAIVAEARAHLEDAIAARLADAPGASLEAITLQETSAFGEPEEVAAAHAPVAWQKPRLAGGKRWLLWAGAALLALLLVVVAVELLQGSPEGIAPYARANEGLVNHTGVVNETFLVPANAVDLLLLVDVSEAADSPQGCAGVRITSPRGAVVLDEWEACGDMHHALRFRPAQSGETGEWRVEIRYREFTGELAIATEGHTR